MATSRRLPRSVWGLFFLCTVAPAAPAVTSEAVRADLMRVDALVRKSQRKAKAAAADDLVDLFRESPSSVTTAACAQEKGGDLACEFTDYSLHALSATNVEDLQLLGGEAMKSLFALRKSDDKTLPTDFEVFCYATQMPKLFDVPAASPFANTAFDGAFRKALGTRCKEPTLANARAFLKEALPLLERTCQVESEGARRQILKNTGENKWEGVAGDCDGARYDLHYDRARKSGELTRIALVTKGGDKCEDVFGDPLGDKDDDDENAAAKKVQAPKAPVTLRQGLFDTAACEQLRWSETFPFLTINLDQGKKNAEGGDPRYEAAVNALFEGDYDAATKGLGEILKKDPGNGLARLALGVARERSGKVEDAVREFGAALGALKAKKIGHSVDGRAVALLHRGATRFEHGKPKEALADFVQAAALEPTSFDAHFWAAAALGELKRDKEAAAEFVRALALRQSFERVTEFVFGEFGDTESMLADFVTPAAAEMLNAAAWRFAVSRDAAVRDGARAVEFARQACDLVDNRNGRYLDTLAVAYAAAGKFKDAAETEAQALEQITSEGAEKDERGAMEKRLALYKDNKTYTE